ncbi:hypothetical protein G9C85_02670 [Halorubellus sp. JP-L1]|uniref:hypothetical protein n=1 Tax=Halorubellus sp. JP-L1 TaxID=2715753 RepID=UPI00140A50CE|nr:hypothetical protein [Halorubellus sp. JP-L1]NHN40542.1 hypothetical protein [Halorubellus sp. JP-L1]
MPTGYCTVDDVRRALQETVTEFDSGAWGASNHQVVVDAITGQTEWVQESTHRHWYESTEVSEDDENVLPSGPLTHTEDEQDIPTRAFLTTTETDRSSYYPPTWVDYDPDDNPDPNYGEMDGLSPQQHRGPFTRVSLFRRDVQTLSELFVLSSTGYEDWVASDDYTEGKAGDYYLHVDGSSGLTQLYLDTNSLDSDLENYAGAVLATYDYGIEGIPQTVRRAVAFRAGSELLMDDQAALGIPENSQLVAAESKKQAMEDRASELLEIHLADSGGP